MNPDTAKFLQLVDGTVIQGQDYVVIECHFHECLLFVSRRTGRIITTMGPAHCECVNLSGHRSKYPESRPKPSVPALKRGRHGSRVQRSADRKRAWREFCAIYLPGRKK